MSLARFGQHLAVAVTDKLKQSIPQHPTASHSTVENDSNEIASRRLGQFKTSRRLIIKYDYWLPSFIESDTVMKDAVGLLVHLIR